MHPRYAPVLTSILLSGVMSFMVSGIATLRTAGFVDGFSGLWISAWLPSWAVAFPALMIFGPFVRKLVARLVKAP